MPRTREAQHSIPLVLHNHIIDYPSPVNINYLWSFGSLAGLFFGFQIVTGIFLAMHYTPDITLAFDSIEHIMRDVRGGWLLRYLHSNGASMIFIMLYIHVGKGLYFRSYAGRGRTSLWISGIFIFLLMMATALAGYVLPWGQMSFWGATVITNLITAIPYIGQDIAYWLWGGFAVGNPTLGRFFSIHYMLPFIIVGLAFLHLVLLHHVGSSNPFGTAASSSDLVTFHPYSVIKDFFSLLVAITFYILIVFFAPNFLGHSDNYINANPLVTPTHIVPEWYFLPFYAILRAVPNKVGGVIAMLSAILILFILPFIDQNSVKSPRFRPFLQTWFWLFVFNFILLGYLGGQVAEEPFITASQVSAGFYFIYFFSLPILNIVSKFIGPIREKRSWFLTRFY